MNNVLCKTINDSDTKFFKNLVLLCSSILSFFFLQHQISHIDNWPQQWKVDVSYVPRKAKILVSDLGRLYKLSSLMLQIHNIVKLWRLNWGLPVCHQIYICIMIDSVILKRCWYHWLNVSVVAKNNFIFVQKLFAHYWIKKKEINVF